MAEEKRAGAAAFAVHPPFEAVIDARPALDPVKAGKFIAAEQVGIVEFQLLTVLVGDVVRVAAIRGINGHDDRFEDLRYIGSVFDEGIAPIEHDLWQNAAADAGQVRLALPLKFVDVIKVAVEAKR